MEKGEINSNSPRSRASECGGLFIPSGAGNGKWLPGRGAKFVSQGWYQPCVALRSRLRGAKITRVAGRRDRASEREGETTEQRQSGKMGRLMVNSEWSVCW